MLKEEAIGKFPDIGRSKKGLCSRDSTQEYMKEIGGVFAEVNYTYEDYLEDKKGSYLQPVKIL